MADAVARLVHHTVSSLTNLFKFRIPVHCSKDQANNTAAEAAFLPPLNAPAPPPYLAPAQHFPCCLEGGEGRTQARAGGGDMPFEPANGILEENKKAVLKLSEGGRGERGPNGIFVAG